MKAVALVAPLLVLGLLHLLHKMEVWVLDESTTRRDHTVGAGRRA